MNRKLLAIGLALLTVGIATVTAQPKIALSVISNEGGAKVMINGKVLGYATPNFSILLPTRTGNITVRVEKDGFIPFEQVVSIGTAPVTVEANLVRKGAAILGPPTPMNQTFTVTVNSSPSGADVYMNGALQGRTPLNMNVQPGNYSLVFRLANYLDVTQNVSVKGNSAVNVALQAQTYPLQVNSNPSGADVYMNGQLSGRTPLNLSLMPGNYSFTLKMANFNDISLSASVPSQSNVSANLTQALIPFVLNNIAPGAEIFFDGKSFGRSKGRDFTAMLTPGQHTLVVRLGGFLDLTATITVGAGVQPYSASMSPIPAKYSLVIPSNLQNPDARNNPQNQLQLFIDGQFRPGFSGSVDSGKHSIRIVSGVLQFETVMDFQSGRDYTIEPFGGINVR